MRKMVARKMRDAFLDERMKMIFSSNQRVYFIIKVDGMKVNVLILT